MTQPSSSGLLALTMILACCLAGCTGRASVTVQPQPTRDANLETQIVSQLQSKDPGAVPLYQQATAALDAGNLLKAMDLYSRLALMVPDFATAYRRIGQIQLELNNADFAIDMAQKAVELEPNGYNQSSLPWRC